jgi:hypothetical protein
LSKKDLNAKNGTQAVPKEIPTKPTHGDNNSSSSGSTGGGKKSHPRRNSSFM